MHRLALLVATNARANLHRGGDVSSNGTFWDISAAVTPSENEDGHCACGQLRNTRLRSQQSRARMTFARGVRRLSPKAWRRADKADVQATSRTCVSHLLSPSSCQHRIRTAGHPDFKTARRNRSELLSFQASLAEISRRQDLLFVDLGAWQELDSSIKAASTTCTLAISSHKPCSCGKTSR